MRLSLSVRFLAMRSSDHIIRCYRLVVILFDVDCFHSDPQSRCPVVLIHSCFGRFYISYSLIPRIFALFASMNSLESFSEIEITSTNQLAHEFNLQRRKKQEFRFLPMCRWRYCHHLLLLLLFFSRKFCWRMPANSKTLQCFQSKFDTFYNIFAALPMQSKVKMMQSYVKMSARWHEWLKVARKEKALALKDKNSNKIAVANYLLHK